MPQRPSHDIHRIPATGSPFEVSNNSVRIPQTLNFVDCYPMEEKQFGDKPLFTVTAREPFKSLGTFDLSTLTTAAVPNNAPTGLVANLSGYVVYYISNLVLLNEDDSGTEMFVNVQMQNPTILAAGSGGTNWNCANVVVSLSVFVSGSTGTILSYTPRYMFFSSGLTLGASVGGNFNAGKSSIDPYYVLLSAPSLSVTVTVGTDTAANPTSLNIYTAAVAKNSAVATTAANVTVVVPAGQTCGQINTGNSWQTGSILTINNAGNILGPGGNGGGGLMTMAHPQFKVAYFTTNYTSGGDAIVLGWPLTVINTGTIGGGGGGGSVSGYLTDSSGKTYGPGSGGGGAGWPVGNPGASITGVSGSSSTFDYAGNVGIAGYAPGTGGYGGTWWIAGGTVGSGSNNGGVAGQPGTAGHVATTTTTAQGGGGGGLGGAGANGGGSAGYAVRLNGYTCSIAPGSYTGLVGTGYIYGQVG